MIATRGGLAAPEAPFVIEHREALIYMLCEAAELEHGIMCQYLFAAFSLKERPDEGLTEDQAATVRRWRKQICMSRPRRCCTWRWCRTCCPRSGRPAHVAAELPAARQPLPRRGALALLPFGQAALGHFMFLERPEGMALARRGRAGRLQPGPPLMRRATSCRTARTSPRSGTCTARSRRAWPT